MKKIKAISSLEKVTDNAAFCEEVLYYTVLKNEKLNFQLLLTSDEDIDYKPKISCDFADSVKAFEVKKVPVGKACYDDSDDYYIDKEPGMYPDLLAEINDTIHLAADEPVNLWIELSGFNKTGNGAFKITAGENVKEITIKVVDAFIPEQSFIVTNWFHCDCIADYYDVEVFSDEFWKITGNFIAAASSHGINCILTPLFTPALDTAPGSERTTVQLVGVKKTAQKYLFDFSNLDKWIDLCRNNGIKYFELSHFFTQWGAEHAPKIIAEDENGEMTHIFGWFTEPDSKEYDCFLKCLAVELRQYFKDKGIEKRIFVHISDEPSKDNLELYGRRAGLIKEIFPDYPVIDALSDYDFYKMGFVDIPIPCENNIEQFFGKVDPLWTYYCCGQHKDYVPNRFICMPSLRNRVLGMLAYKYNLKGFLQWGYNFYNSQLSIKRIDPYKVTDSDGSFPAGDAFVVYPGKNGTPELSLRLKVFYDGIQDYEALTLLEKKIGREKVLELTGDISFSNYPHDNSRLLNLRNRVNEMLEQ